MYKKRDYGEVVHNYLVKWKGFSYSITITNNYIIKRLVYEKDTVGLLKYPCGTPNWMWWGT
jgi:hypothetical protein